ncbi:MAG: dual specificity protein phosphatase family protein [Anaerolineae bacterium]
MRVENFGWLIEGQLAGSGRPIHHEELIWLRELGIGAIVSLTERSLRREKLLLHRLDPLGFTYRHIPVVDETAPSQAQIDEFVALVDEMLGQDGPCREPGRTAVLVHCQGGYGRTGTMLACYLVSRGWGAEEAIAEVRARRPGSIVPQIQQACVVEYARRLRRESAER